MDIGKLETIHADLSNEAEAKLSNETEKNVVKETVYDELLKNSLNCLKCYSDY